MVDVWKRPEAGCPDQVQQSNWNLPEETCPPAPDAESQASRAAQSGKPPIPTISSQRTTHSQECSTARGFTNQPETGTEGFSPSESSQFSPAFRPNPSLSTDPTLPPRGPHYLSGVRSQGCSPSRGHISQNETHSELSSPFRGPHFPPGFYTSSASSMDPTEANVQSSLPLRGLQNRMRAQSEGRPPIKQQFPASFYAPPLLPMKQTTGFNQGSVIPKGLQYLTGVRSQGYSSSKGPAKPTGTGFGELLSEGPQYLPPFRANPSLPMNFIGTNVQGYLLPRGQSGVRSQGCSPSRGNINQTGTHFELTLPSGGPPYTPERYVPSNQPMNPTAANNQDSLPPRDLSNQMRAQSGGSPPVSQQCLSGFGAQSTLQMKPAEASIQSHLPPRGFTNPSVPPCQNYLRYLGHQNVNAATDSQDNFHEEPSNSSRVKTPEFPSLRCPCPLIQAGQRDSCERPHQRYGLPVFLNDLDVQASGEVEQDGTSTFACSSSKQLTTQNGTVDQPCPPASCFQNAEVPPCAQPSTQSSGLQDVYASPCAQPSTRSSGLQDTNAPPCSHPSTRSSGQQDVKVSPCAQPSTRSSGRQELNALPCAKPSTRSSGVQDLNASPCDQPCPRSSGLQEANASPCAQPSTRSSGAQ
ncbi:unnamed protein product, partial [Taenia asiatica]|uniref:Zinc finger protein 469 n=1 Tax=Taenia asiatica TaxID=60517 RepID=A0A0R3VTV0_TAEAS